MPLDDPVDLIQPAGRISKGRISGCDMGVVSIKP